MSKRPTTVRDLIMELLHQPLDAVVVQDSADGSGVVGVGGAQVGYWQPWTDYHNRSHPGRGEYDTKEPGIRAVYLWPVD